MSGGSGGRDPAVRVLTQAAGWTPSLPAQMPRFFRRFSSRKRHLTEAAADLEETKQLKKSAKERRLAARAKAGGRGARGSGAGLVATPIKIEEQDVPDMVKQGMGGLEMGGAAAGEDFKCNIGLLDLPSKRKELAAMLEHTLQWTRTAAEREAGRWEEVFDEPPFGSGQGGAVGVSYERNDGSVEKSWVDVCKRYQSALPSPGVPPQKPQGQPQHHQQEPQHRQQQHQRPRQQQKQKQQQPELEAEQRRSKRGRRPKKDASEGDGSKGGAGQPKRSSNRAPAAAASPVKRGRGRPRKYPLPDAPVQPRAAVARAKRSSSSSSSSSATKQGEGHRGPGRPRKPAVEEVVVVDSDEEEEEEEEEEEYEEEYEYEYE